MGIKEGGDYVNSVRAPLCRKLYDEGKFNEFELMVFEAYMGDFLTKPDHVLKENFSCVFDYSEYISGDQKYKANYKTKVINGQTQYLHGGSLVLTFLITFPDDFEYEHGWPKGIRFMFFHKDVNPGVYDDFEKVSVKDIEHVRVEYSGGDDHW